MRIIKKYSNRRLYDTERSAYLNLDELAGLIRGGEEVQVVDAKSGDDLTRGVLLQVILEVQGSRDLLPVGLLHRLIRFHGDHPMQKLATRQLAAGLELLDGQLRHVERAVPWASGMKPDAPPPADEPEAEPDAEAPGDEMDALRQRLAALEERLKR